MMTCGRVRIDMRTKSEVNICVCIFRSMIPHDERKLFVLAM